MIMDYNKIIIALIVIFIALLAGFGIMFFNTSDSKITTTIVATSNSTLHDGENFSIILVDINGTPLANQTVNITMTGSNGERNQHQITTDAKGNGMLQLNGLNPGEYTVNVTYGGNSNYSASNITQKIEIKEIVKQTSSSSYNGGSSKSSGGSPVPGVSASDYNEILSLSHGDEELAKVRAQSYHESGYI